jgi:MFS family permease
MQTLPQDRDPSIGANPAPSAIGAPGVSTGRALYTLLVLSLVCLLNYYDRNLINILIQPIKLDLGLSDAQLGIVSGTAFGIVYCAVAIPVGRLADRSGRLRVLVAALALWSVMTGACGLVRNFTGMVAARFGVGFGESAGLPTTHALVAEHFSPAWRGRALGLIAVMSAVGLGLGSGFGGVIADHWGWRAAFLSGAVPGILVALLLGLTVREPLAPGHGDAPQLGFAAAMRILWRRTAFVWLCLGMGIGSIGSYAFLTWIAPFVMRTFHASASVVGGQLSVVFFISNIVGVSGGGLLGDTLSKRDRRWPLWICAICFGVGFAGLFAVVSMPTLGATMIAIALYMTLFIAYTGPVYAVVQQLCGDRLRATGSAIFLTVANLVGLGAGPWFAGFLSDRLQPTYGDGSLRIALMATSVTCLVGAICFAIGARTAIRDIADADRDARA